MQYINSCVLCEPELDYSFIRHKVSALDDPLNNPDSPPKRPEDEPNEALGEETAEESVGETAEESVEETAEELVEDPEPLNETGRLIDNAEMAYRLGWRWASFELYVISPVIHPIVPPLFIAPDPLVDDVGLEFVYPIHDYGFKMSTSKADDMLSSGMSMCKLFYTIEKMLFLFIERLKSGGTTTDTEVQVAFSGFILAQRKAFESIINLSYNVVVTNFEPGEWGEKYLQIIKRLADKGFGYPPEAPRDIYRHGHHSSGASVR